MKKITLLSIILIISLCLNFIVPVMAATNDRITLLVDMGVLKEPEKSGLIKIGFSRADFANALYKMDGVQMDFFNYSKEDAAQFASDIENIENNYAIINAIVNNQMKVVDGKFFPNADLSYKDAIYALVNKLGYEERAQKNGGDDNAYYSVALKIGLLRGVKVADAKKLDYSAVANLIANAMEVTLGASSQIYAGSPDTYSVSNIKKYSGRILSNSNIGLATAVTDKNYVNISGKVMPAEVAVENYLIGAKVVYYTAYVNGAERVISISVKGDMPVKLAASDISEVKEDGEDLVIIKKNDEKLTLERSGYAIVNGNTITPQIEMLNAFKSGEVVLLDTDNNGKYDVGNFTLLNQIVVNSISKLSNTITDKYDNTKVLLEDLDYCEIILNNKPAKLEDIKPGMVAGVGCDNFTFSGENVTFDFTKAKKVWIYASNQTINGLVEAIDEEGSVLVDEMWVDVGKSYNTLISLNKIQKIKVGEYVVLNLDYYDEIVYYTLDLNSNSYEYGYLIATGFTRDAFSKKIEMKILDERGTYHIYPVSDKFILDGKREKSDRLSYATSDLQTIDLTKRQVIKYQIKDDAIYKIDTAVIRSSHERKEFSLSEDLKCNPRASEPEGYYVYDNSIGKQYVFKEKCFAFVDDAPIADTNPDEKSIFVTNDLTQYGSETYNVAGYDASDLNELSCLVFYTNISGASSGSGKSMGASVQRAFVVETVRVATNEDGDEGWKLGLVGQGKRENLFVLSDSKIYRATKWMNQNFDMEECAMSDIDKGDVIRFKTNARNEINYIEKMFDFSSHSTYEGSNLNFAGSESGLEYGGQVIGFANVEKTSENSILYSFGHVQSNPDEQTYVFRKNEYRNPKVTVYDVETRTASLMDYSDLPSSATGDNVKVFLRYVDRNSLLDYIFYLYE